MRRPQRIERRLPQQLLEALAFLRADIAGVLALFAGVAVVAVNFQQPRRLQQVVPLLLQRKALGLEPLDDLLQIVRRARHRLDGLHPHLPQLAVDLLDLRQQAVDLLPVPLALLPGALPAVGQHGRRAVVYLFWKAHLLFPPSILYRSSPISHRPSCWFSLISFL